MMKPRVAAGVLFLGLTGASSAAGDGLSLSAGVFPRIVTPGGALKASCVVRPASEKKLGKLTIEVPGYTSSAKDIEGEEGRNQYTRELWIYHVPCGSTEVVCRLEREDGTRVSKAVFAMPACPGEDGELTSPPERGAAGVE